MHPRSDRRRIPRAFSSALDHLRSPLEARITAALLHHPHLPKRMHERWRRRDRARSHPPASAGECNEHRDAAYQGKTPVWASAGLRPNWPSAKGRNHHIARQLDLRASLASKPVAQMSALNSDLLTLGYHKMSGFGAETVAVPGSPGEPGKASPMRGGGRMVKRMRRCEPGKTVAV